MVLTRLNPEPNLLETRSWISASKKRIANLKLVAGTIIEVSWADAPNQNAIVNMTPTKNDYVEASFRGKGKHANSWVTDTFGGDQIVRVLGVFDLDSMMVSITELVS